MCLILYPMECKYQPAVYTNTNNNHIFCFLKPLCPVVAALKFNGTALMSNTVSFNCFQPHLPVTLDKSISQMTEGYNWNIWTKCNLTCYLRLAKMLTSQLTCYKINCSNMCVQYFLLLNTPGQNLWLVNGKFNEDALEDSFGYDWMANATLTCFSRCAPTRFYRQFKVTTDIQD